MNPPTFSYSAPHRQDSRKGFGGGGVILMEGIQRYDSVDESNACFILGEHGFFGSNSIKYRVSEMVGKKQGTQFRFNIYAHPLLDPSYYPWLEKDDP